MLLGGRRCRCGSYAASPSCRLPCWRRSSSMGTFGDWPSLVLDARAAGVAVAAVAAWRRAPFPVVIGLAAAVTAASGGSDAVRSPIGPARGPGPYGRRRLLASLGWSTSPSHGHFYQPPRENPWTETVPVEPSAAPYHDWNERITAECYRPNAHARVVDERGRVVAIVDNYEQLSLQRRAHAGLVARARHHPTSYDRIVAADRIGRARHRAGLQPHDPAAGQRARHPHAGALGPRRLRASASADPPTGMWLPETAVNDDVLAVLVEEGVRLHDPGSGAGAPAPLEAGRTYAVAAPWRRRAPLIALVFYDGPLTTTSRSGHRVAVGRGAACERAAGAAARRRSVVRGDRRRDVRPPPPLAERTLAYALGRRGAATRACSTGPIGGWLDGPSARATVGVRESAWSCAHGARPLASEDCGCSTGGRPGLEPGVADAAARRARPAARPRRRPCSSERGVGGLRDPWAARDAYVDVLLDPAGVDAFLADHLRRRRRPDAWPSRCSRSSATPCSCTRGAAGSSTTSPASRRCRCCATRRGAWICSGDRRRAARAGLPRRARPRGAATTRPRGPAARCGPATCCRPVSCRPASWPTSHCSSCWTASHRRRSRPATTSPSRITSSRIGVRSAWRVAAWSLSTAAPAASRRMCTRRCTSAPSRWWARAVPPAIVRPTGATSPTCAPRSERGCGSPSCCGSSATASVPTSSMSRRPCPTRRTACCTPRRARWPTASEPSSTGCSPTTAT